MQPVPHGYPDWGRQTAPTDIILLPLQTINMAADTVIFEGYVGNASFINVQFNGAANPCRVVFTFFESASLGTFITTVRYALDANAFLRLSVPVGGPHMRVEIDGSVFPIAPTVSLIIGTSRQVWHREDTGVPPVLIASNAVPVGVAATVTATALAVVPGLAMLSIDTALATWTARLQAVTGFGAYRTIASLRNTSLPGPRLVMLPPASCRIEFTNTTAAAGACDMHLVSHSGGNF